ncbi:MAG: hypothetical protein GVY05_05105 [Bacteroidetes bacterium]|jgi:hypothetical protein|nr:hypothetical protein [Bacteroidota bacterium]
MRLIAILTATLICQFVIAQGKSLKIQLDDEFYYPPNLKFEVLDDTGKQVLTEEDLDADKPIILEGHYTINVFTTWADGQDSFEVKDEALIALEDNKSYVALNKDDQKSWHKNKPKVVDKSFQVNKGQYDAIIAFEKDIFFNYIDGEVEITQNGRPLKLLGKYVAKTSEGFLKMSYNPKNKEYWYVFTDTYNKVIYQ